MKCYTHATEAVGVCAYCGRGLCADCAKSGGGGIRLTCSPNCAAALTRAEQALESILQKSLQSAKVSAYYSYLCAALSGGGAVAAERYLPSPYLVGFTTACCVVFLASGFWYGRVARRGR